MNRKGFTLIELLASVIILSLIMLIGVSTVSGVADMIKVKNRENTIKDIEIAASKYAFDTGKTKIFVDELVTYGYIKGDNAGKVIDDVSNESLNCYIVMMTKNNNSYMASFKDGESYEVDGKCDESILNELNEELSFLVTLDGKDVDDTNGWLKGRGLNLKITSNENLDCENNLCTFISSNGLNKRGTSEIEIALEDNVVITNRYSFQFSMFSGGKVKKYNTSISLKIDNEKPKINQISINKETKKIVVEANDGLGSGISGYYKTILGGNCASNSIVYNSSNELDVEENGSYLICVKDEVGNIEFENIVVDDL